MKIEPCGPVTRNIGDRVMRASDSEQIGSCSVPGCGPARSPRISAGSISARGVGAGVLAPGGPGRGKDSQEGIGIGFGPEARPHPRGRRPRTCRVACRLGAGGRGWALCPCWRSSGAGRHFRADSEAPLLRVGCFIAGMDVRKGNGVLPPAPARLGRARGDRAVTAAPRRLIRYYAPYIPSKGKRHKGKHDSFRK